MAEVPGVQHVATATDPGLHRLHRLFWLAVDNAKRRAGTDGWRLVGLELRKALVMAEVAYIIGGQDSEAAGPAMIRLAEYAAAAVEVL